MNVNVNVNVNGADYNDEWQKKLAASLFQCKQLHQNTCENAF